ncbi:Peroxidase 67 [Sesamum angolense]|uniref:peroxidase n=1 Tax=Sesamum angolense TaxID=2727404 RepID=A0AAE2C3H4_9LAMI|nr:Peroxidase 67 [Sesamum angolense]
MVVGLLVVLAQLKGSSSTHLSTDFYKKSCPKVFSIVKSVVKSAVMEEKRMGASLLRLHFHDCFVQGCDASILLDDTSTFKGEKTAGGNNNSVRGYEVIDHIKLKVEEACPGIVSCADIVTIAARDSVALLGGPKWKVKVGRRDSKTASLEAANSGVLPSPASNLSTLIQKFKDQGLSPTDLVALSGTPPARSKNSENFDNAYFKNLKAKKGLLHSDQALYSGGSTDWLVELYSRCHEAFHKDLVAAMIKMGNISPLTGLNGEIRKNCRRPN